MTTLIIKDELKYWLAFNQIPKIGPVRFQKLLNYFPDLKTAWQAVSHELIKAGIEPGVAEELISLRLEIDPALELEKVEKIKVQITTILDPNYPKLLKEIYAPPPLIYHFGNLDLNNDFPLAVVGRRKISQYGKQITSEIVSELANCSLTIVSGLALGIDACAHQATLQNSGKTVAVLGSGLNQIYPASNRKLAQEIIESGGSIISEFPLGTPPYKSNFPQRNRIISGLSLGVLVTEAGEKSGALITAAYALEQNREVFAVPGNIYSAGSIGPNNLVRLGAKLVTGAADILEVLNLSEAKDFKNTKELIPENETEKILLELITTEAVHVDKLVQCARLDISIINSTLSLMEMKGMVKNLGNQKYVKAR
ncbi:MAG: DNA-processing protein DprA [Patescibacteria group bacterium]|jgi:DNA processing protein